VIGPYLGVSGPKKAKLLTSWPNTGATTLLDFGEICIVYPDFFLYKCFKFGAFWFINKGVLCKKTETGQMPA